MNADKMIPALSFPNYVYLFSSCNDNMHIKIQSLKQVDNFYIWKIATLLGETGFFFLNTAVCCLLKHQSKRADTLHEHNWGGKKGIAKLSNMLLFCIPFSNPGFPYTFLDNLSFKVFLISSSVVLFLIIKIEQGIIWGKKTINSETLNIIEMYNLSLILSSPQPLPNFQYIL